MLTEKDKERILKQMRSNKDLCLFNYNIERNVPLGEGETDGSFISATKEALQSGKDLSPYQRTKLKAEYENRNLAKNIKFA